MTAHTGEVSVFAHTGEVSMTAHTGEVSLTARTGEVSLTAHMGEVSIFAHMGEVSLTAHTGEMLYYLYMNSKILRPESQRSRIERVVLGFGSSSGLHRDRTRVTHSSQPGLLTPCVSRTQLCLCRRHCGPWSKVMTYYVLSVGSECLS